MLIVLGYALHMPVGLLFAHDAQTVAAAFGQALAVDVLQCIGVSLSMLEALALALPSAARWKPACFASAPALMLVRAARARGERAGRWLPLAELPRPRATGRCFRCCRGPRHVLLARAARGPAAHRQSDAARSLAAAALAIGLRGRWCRAGTRADHVSAPGLGAGRWRLLLLLEPASASAGRRGCGACRARRCSSTLSRGAGLRAGRRARSAVIGPRVVALCLRGARALP